MVVAKEMTPRVAQSRTPSGNWQEKMAHPIATVILSAVVGAGSALLVAAIDAGVTVQTVQQQLQAEREKEHREKTPAIYTAYLDAASRYRTAQVNLVAYTGQNGLRNGDDNLNLATALADPTARELLNLKNSAASTYETAVDGLAVYGSDEAWKIHQRIASMSGRVVDADGDGVDETSFENYVDDMRIEFCKTVSLHGEACGDRRLAPDYIQKMRG
ncbi:hypothetical protein [Paenarthrobacter sp. A20]|uniref:hypothetical protein n=1 Tax=Paenarthrobacter sp. A20 TaxID=2817891 RepID=UPI0020A14C30|nr:hypothetical protein [Paenarthrobacter sp. A20]MCP1412904.1 hypothetical protein [Paenarthrobacter sp. A20]